MRSGGGYTWHVQGCYQYGRWRGNLPRRRRSLSSIPFESIPLTPHEWTNQRRGRGGRRRSGPPHSSPLTLQIHLGTTKAELCIRPL
ncbi:unnamed protein product [Calypogeia fissa]